MTSSPNINTDVFISLVIPCYNEEARIAPLLAALNMFSKNFGHTFEFIIVDDGSKDRTIEVIESNSFIQSLRSLKKCILYTKKPNAGKGEALKTGVDIAKGHFILTMDADVATHPMEISKWMEKENLDSNTIYIGSREHSESVITSGFTRKLAGRIFNLIVRLLTPLKLKDTQCGFKLYPSAIGKKVFSELTNTGWAHDIELLYRAKLDGCKIKEMPIKWDSIEGSKISVMRDSIRMFSETIKISRLLKEKNGPKRS